VVDCADVAKHTTYAPRVFLNWVQRLFLLAVNPDGLNINELVVRQAELFTVKSFTERG